MEGVPNPIEQKWTEAAQFTEGPLPARGKKEVAANLKQTIQVLGEWVGQAKREGRAVDPARVTLLEKASDKLDRLQQKIARRVSFDEPVKPESNRPEGALPPEVSSPRKGESERHLEEAQERAKELEGEVKKEHEELLETPILQDNPYAGLDRVDLGLFSLDGLGEAELKQLQGAIKWRLENDDWSPFNKNLEKKLTEIDGKL